MRHAYLIIAHNEFEILSLLVNALDDYRNDIYIHFDKKLLKLPKLEVSRANLIILNERIDVRWGHVSQIEVEFLLFETAFININANYSYYHLLSGVDIPIKSQNYIHNFFLEQQDREFIGFTQGDSSKEIDRKVRRYHFFSDEFRYESGLIHLIKKSIRSSILILQEIFGIKRNKNIDFKKGTNWVSVTNNFVGYLLKNKNQTLKKYAMTYCADEIFLQTICWNSPFKEMIYDLHDSRNSSKRMINWQKNVIHDWRVEDVDFLVSSNGLFARKFSKRNINVVHQILNKIVSY